MEALKNERVAALKSSFLEKKRDKGEEAIYRECRRAGVRHSEPIIQDSNEGKK